MGQYKCRFPNTGNQFIDDKGRQLEKVFNDNLGNQIMRMVNFQLCSLFVIEITKEFRINTIRNIALKHVEWYRSFLIENRYTEEYIVNAMRAIVFMHQITPNTRHELNIPEEYLQITCPYCGERATLIDSAIIYRESYGNIYLCSNYPECDSFVGVHNGTDIPHGSLANSKLREIRKTAHARFDQLWQTGGMARNSAYRWLAQQLNIPVDNTHIGYFDLDMCKKVIKICEQEICDF